METQQSLKSVSDQICSFITDRFLMGDAAKRVSPSDDLLTTGIIDSLGVMQLIAFIEGSFSISVPPGDVTIENFISVDAMSDYIVRQAATS